MFGGMKRKDIIVSYLRDSVVWIALYLAEAILFLAIAALYGYGDMFRNMTYALWLVLFLEACFVVWDFRRYGRKATALSQGMEREERDRYLPDTSSMPERLYQEMIIAEEKEKRALVTALDEKQRDMADYYTMWTHQIKTPLAAMRLLLQNEEGVFADARTGKQILEELFKTEQYADMALSYARLQSISSDFIFQKQDVFAMVKSAVKKYSVFFIGSGLQFRLEEFAADIVTDRKWFCFVVEQVLSNALKYTEKGGIAIYGTDRRGNRAIDSCEVIVIEDTGIGIEESDLPRIFERGFTGYNGRMDKKSTGIGLYLCKQVMDRLGLGIAVESKRGEGTRVLLTLACREKE